MFIGPSQAGIMFLEYFWMKDFFSFSYQNPLFISSSLKDIKLNWEKTT